jgi:hypothetical protein
MAERTTCGHLEASFIVSSFDLFGETLYITWLLYGRDFRHEVAKESFNLLAKRYRASWNSTG